MVQCDICDRVVSTQLSYYLKYHIPNPAYDTDNTDYHGYDLCSYCIVKIQDFIKSMRLKEKDKK